MGRLPTTDAGEPPCIGDKQAENKLLYALTNVAKDNLVEHTSESPFFTTYHHQAKGETPCFWYIDYDAYWTAGGRSKKTHRLKDYLPVRAYHCGDRLEKPCHVRHPTPRFTRFVCLPPCFNEADGFAELSPIIYKGGMPAVFE